MQAKYESIFGTNIIPFSKDEESFSQILERAYQKQAPFLSDPKASDKGFKDSLIWLSLLKFFKENGSDHVVFVSDDGGFKNNAKILTEEFLKVTGKTIEIKDNSYYQKLIEVRPEINKLQPLETIPNIEQLREEIQTVIGNLCSVERYNYYGDSWDASTFTISEEFDPAYIETVFENLKYTISVHLFEQSIPATEVFGSNDHVSDGEIDIPISALEGAINLHNQIQQQYPGHIQQFYTAAANILNRNYRTPCVKADTKPEKLPF